MDPFVVPSHRHDPACEPQASAAPVAGRLTNLDHGRGSQRWPSFGPLGPATRPRRPEQAVAATAVLGTLAWAAAQPCLMVLTPVRRRSLS